MKVLQDRLKSIKREQEVLLDQLPSESPEMQILLAMINLRISLEVDILQEISNNLSDKSVDNFFPLAPEADEKFKKITTIKRNAVKSFIKYS